MKVDANASRCIAVPVSVSSKEIPSDLCTFGKLCMSARLQKIIRRRRCDRWQSNDNCEEKRESTFEKSASFHSDPEMPR